MDDPAKRRVRKRKAERRREIAEAAIKLMGKHGLYGTTVSRIAKAVGITNSAVYKHYHNREAVLWAATDMISERAHDWIVATSGTEGSGLERLRRIGERHLAWSSSRIDTFVRPVFALAAGGKQAGMGAYSHHSVQRSIELLLPLVHEGQMDGSIRTDIEARDAAWSILMFAWAEDMGLLTGSDDVTTGGVSRRNLERLMDSFRPPEAPPQECAADLPDGRLAMIVE